MRIGNYAAKAIGTAAGCSSCDNTVQSNDNAINTHFAAVAQTITILIVEDSTGDGPLLLVAKVGRSRTVSRHRDRAVVGRRAYKAR